MIEWVAGGVMLIAGAGCFGASGISQEQGDWAGKRGLAMLGALLTTVGALLWRIA